MSGGRKSRSRGTDRWIESREKKNGNKYHVHVRRCVRSDTTRRSDYSDQLVPYSSNSIFNVPASNPTSHQDNEDRGVYMHSASSVPTRSSEMYRKRYTINLGSSTSQVSGPPTSYQEDRPKLMNPNNRVQCLCSSGQRTQYASHEEQWSPIPSTTHYGSPNGSSGGTRQGYEDSDVGDGSHLNYNMHGNPMQFSVSGSEDTMTERSDPDACTYEQEGSQYSRPGTNRSYNEDRRTEHDRRHRHNDATRRGARH